ncbi:MAG: ATP-dependent RecD-like DNA helicase [Chlamydiae bacterium]|nr:ATP-dependent RecD-like DNA helicase [Chlamydiota bacterium]
MEQIYGYIESIVFSEEEKGFTVARLKEPKKADLTCIVGYMPSIQPGETITCKGAWKTHPHHGKQFEVSEFVTTAPSDVVGIQKYLESGLIKGIGPAYAEKIVKQFGLKTLDIIDETPHRLLEIPGIGDKRVEKIISCWDQQKSIRSVMIFLRSHQVSPAYAQKIYKTYGDKSIEKVQSNPYALAKEIFGIGFKTADKIANSLGIPLDSPIRIKAAIEHMLWEVSNEGHVCYPKPDLLQDIATLLELSGLKVEAALKELTEQGDVVLQEEMLWVKPLYLCEIGIAREIARLNQYPSQLRTVHLEKAIEWVQQKLSIQLAPEQKIAVQEALLKKQHIITGGPGTGKSTITKAILAITEKLTDKILLAAPTGRAAKRMTEITRKKAFTIHSLLEMNFQAGGFKRNRENPLVCDLLIVDESSMIDTQLMYHLLKAIPNSARVIFIGDIDQLPSVGPGNVLKDMISSERIGVTQLKQIFRQAAGSRIITNAHRINQGEFPDISYAPKNDFIFIEKETPEEIASAIVELVKNRLTKNYRFHRFDDIQVLSPMKRGIIGCENLNMLLQKELNPSMTPLLRMGQAFHVGDKVMQIRNNYQKHVYNGDVGKIVALDMTEQELQVLFDGKTVTYDFTELDELTLAYAVSIHKYQGSECPCIIIPIHISHFKLLNRNLIYTGVTRGKRLVILLGSKKALAIGVKNEEVKKRNTGLVQALLQFLPETLTLKQSQALQVT